MTDQRATHNQAAGIVPARRAPTLLQHFADFLHQAELLYGPRDHDFTQLGIEFGAGGPKTFFPAPVECRYVTVVLSEAAAQDGNRAAWELAGLTVHLLAPGPGLPDVVLERGAAFVFQMMQARRLGIGLQAGGAYRAAGVLVGEAMADDPGVIRRARAIEPTFSAMTPALLESVGVAPALAAELMMPFDSLNTFGA